MIITISTHTDIISHVTRDTEKKGYKLQENYI